MQKVVPSRNQSGMSPENFLIFFEAFFILVNYQARGIIVYVRIIVGYSQEAVEP